MILRSSAILGQRPAHPRRHQRQRTPQLQRQQTLRRQRQRTHRLQPPQTRRRRHRHRQLHQLRYSFHPLSTVSIRTQTAAVRVVVVQSDGKTLIGGDFTSLSPNGGSAVTRNRIARLNPDGTVDAAFDPNADGIIRSIAVQSDGTILAGGDFSSIGGQTRNHIARLDAVTGSADPFNPNANGFVDAIAVQADGKILIGGGFSTVLGVARTTSHVLIMAARSTPPLTRTRTVMSMPSRSRRTARS